MSDLRLATKLYVLDPATSELFLKISAHSRLKSRPDTCPHLTMKTLFGNESPGLTV
jgi:hypothetical protein